MSKITRLFYLKNGGNVVRKLSLLLAASLSLAFLFVGCTNDNNAVTTITASSTAATATSSETSAPETSETTVDPMSAFIGSYTYSVTEDVITIDDAGNIHISLIGLASFDGTSTVDGDVLLIDTEDVDGNPIQFSLKAEADGYVLTCVDSTWPLIVSGKTFPFAKD